MCPTFPSCVIQVSYWVSEPQVPSWEMVMITIPYSYGCLAKVHMKIYKNSNNNHYYWVASDRIAKLGPRQGSYKSGKSSEMREIKFLGICFSLPPGPLLITPPPKSVVPWLNSAFRCIWFGLKNIYILKLELDANIIKVEDFTFTPVYQAVL